MAPMVDSISKIISRCEAWGLKVHVIRLWVVPMFNNAVVASSMEMVLIDEVVSEILFF